MSIAVEAAHGSSKRHGKSEGIENEVAASAAQHFLASLYPVELLLARWLCAAHCMSWTCASLHSFCSYDLTSMRCDDVQNVDSESLSSVRLG